MTKMRFVAAMWMTSVALAGPMAPQSMAQAPASSAFTYQGRLKINGVLHNGAADLCFKLYDAPNAGSLVTGPGIANPLAINGVLVSKGLFSASLDFGFNAFAGDERWLEISVRTNPGPADCVTGYNALSARQPINPAPYATHSLTPWEFDPASNSVSFMGGNVGIGTTAPADLLHVMLTDSYARFDRNVLNSTPQVVINHGNPAGNSTLSFRNQTAVKWNIGSIPALGDALEIATAQGAKMMITQNGNVGIGTSTPVSQLHIANANEVEARVTSGTSAASFTLIPGSGVEWNLLTPGTGGSFQIQQGVDRRLTINQNGNVVIGDFVSASDRLRVDGTIRADDDITTFGNFFVGAMLCTCSDGRFKTARSPISNPLDILAQLEGIHFRWRSEEFPERRFSHEPQIGFVAQDVREVLPQIVTEDAEGYYGVDYGRLTPVLVEAVKELHGIVQDKDAQVAAQQSQIDDLTQRLATIERLMKAQAAPIDVNGHPAATRSDEEVLP